MDHLGGGGRRAVGSDKREARNVDGQRRRRGRGGGESKLTDGRGRAAARRVGLVGQVKWRDGGGWVPWRRLGSSVGVTMRALLVLAVIGPTHPTGRVAVADRAESWWTNGIWSGLGVGGANAAEGLEGDKAAWSTEGHGAGRGRWTQVGGATGQLPEARGLLAPPWAQSWADLASPGDYAEGKAEPAQLVGACVCTPQWAVTSERAGGASSTGSAEAAGHAVRDEGPSSERDRGGGRHRSGERAQLATVAAGGGWHTPVERGAVRRPAGDGRRRWNVMPEGPRSHGSHAGEGGAPAVDGGRAVSAERERIIRHGWDCFEMPQEKRCAYAVRAAEVGAMAGCRGTIQVAGGSGERAGCLRSNDGGRCDEVGGPVKPSSGNQGSARGGGGGAEGRMKGMEGRSCWVDGRTLGG